MALGDLPLPFVRALLVFEVTRKITKRGQGAQNARIAALSTLLGLLAVMRGGPRHSLISTVLGVTHLVENAWVTGYVAPGFEDVKRAFEANVRAGLEVGAQFVVYRKGVKVVDLVGGSTHEERYNEDSLQICFSCSKVVTSIVVALAVDHGRISYDEKVSTYWPEFAQNGKEDITVADVLRHDSGLAYYAEKMPVELAHPSRADELAAYIAKEAPFWLREEGFEPKSRLYQGSTRGFILNEIIRRTDPQHRTVAQVLRQEISTPLGISASFGEQTADERRRTVRLKFDGIHHTVGKQAWKRLTLSSRPDAITRTGQFLNQNSPVQKWLSAFTYNSSGVDEEHFYNDEIFRSFEIPSVNMVSNARSLAALADLQSRDALLSKETADLAHGGVERKYDYGICLKNSFNRGGWCDFNDNVWNKAFKGFVGWGGFGGSMVAWNREEQLGLSYTMNGPQLFSIQGARDKRCVRLMAAVRKCSARFEAAKL